MDSLEVTDVEAAVMFFQDYGRGTVVFMLSLHQFFLIDAVDVQFSLAGPLAQKVEFGPGLVVAAVDAPQQLHVGELH